MMRTFLKGLFLFTFLLATSSLFGRSSDKVQEYVVLAAKSLENDPEWARVVEALQKKHGAPVLYYKENPRETLGKLKTLRPRYVAVVEKPELIGRDYIIGLNKLCREVDDDIYEDFLWGVITGYTAASALKMVDQSTEPLTVRSAVSTIMELESGKWFDRFAYIDDHHEGVCGEKKEGGEMIAGRIGNSKGEAAGFTFGAVPVAGRPDLLQKFCDQYAAYDPDLVVTAAHATENNLEMPFSLGNIKSKNGVLYADFPGSPKNLIESGKRKVYFAVGNCLIGNVNKSRESMAVAWMNSANAATMVGYVVPTWHGRNGWGGLKYWLTLPGRTTLAQAIYLNRQDMLAQEYEWCPKILDVDFPFDKGLDAGAGLLRKALGAEPAKDQLGFFHDRNVLAYYGDPKWEVRLQAIPEENDFTTDIRIEEGQCVVTITTNADFRAERMAGSGFKQEHVLDLPFSYFFPERLVRPRLAAGQLWKAVVDENFLLVYHPGFEAGRTYTIVLDCDK